MNELKMVSLDPEYKEYVALASDVTKVLPSLAKQH